MGTASQVCDAYRLLGGRFGSQDAESRVYDALVKYESRKVDLEPIKEIMGDDYCSCASEVSWDGWKERGANNIVLVPDYSSVFSAGIAAFAGSLDAPILPYNSDNVSTPVVHAIRELHATDLYIVGSSSDVEKIKTNQRLRSLGNDIHYIDCGEGYCQHQSVLINFTVSNNCLNGDTAFVLSASQMASAFTVAHLAYLRQSPIVLFGDGEVLGESLVKSLKDAKIDKLVVFGANEQSPEIRELVNVFEISYVDNTYPLNTTEFVEVAKWCENFGGINSKRLLIASGIQPHWQALISLPAYAAKTNSNVLLIDDTNLASVDQTLAFIDGRDLDITFIGNHGPTVICKNIIMNAVKNN
jgi:hypothetical protein